MPVLKRPNRELTIFSLSALDIFASAMGTFILIAIVLFPYYLRQDSPVREALKGANRIEELKRRIKGAEGRKKKAQAAAKKAQAEAEKLRRQAAKGAMSLPKGGKDPNSLKFAIGCWRTEPFRHSPRHKPGISQYCFDKSGGGSLVYYRLKDRFVCAAFASITRQGSTITITDRNTRCNIGQRDKGPWHADRLVCRPDARRVVSCEGRSGTGARWRVRLLRQ